MREGIVNTSNGQRGFEQLLGRLLKVETNGVQRKAVFNTAGSRDPIVFSFSY